MGRPERWVVGGSGFFTAFRMTEGRGVHVILRSEATKNPSHCTPTTFTCAYILTNETHSLHIESEESWVYRPER